MEIYKLTNILSNEEVEYFKNKINLHKNFELDNVLGRSVDIFSIEKIPKNILKKLIGIAEDITKKKLKMAAIVYAEYNIKYGDPNLPPHFDGDTNDLVIDFQLESNTSWDLGIETQTYSLEDNSGLIFNANQYIHWRPHKIFKDGEYIKMLFFRFYDPINLSDYSGLPMDQDNEVFKSARDFRDSLI